MVLTATSAPAFGVASPLPNRKQALRDGYLWAIDKGKKTAKELLYFYKCLLHKFSPNKDLYTYMFFIRTHCYSTLPALVLS